jgi:pyruvate-formate lyase-activating enzyme
MKAEIGTYPKDRQILHKIVPLDTPLCVDLHVTHLCNLRCNYCALTVENPQFVNRDIKREQMTPEVFKLVVEQLSTFPKKMKMITMAGVGEALTHPHIADFVRQLRDSGVTEKIQIISNATLLTPQMSDELIAAGLGELKISLQGLDAKKYKEIADVDIKWDEFYGNIKYFSSVRGKCALKVKVADIALERDDEEKFYSLFGDICDAVAIEHIYNAWLQNGVDVRGVISNVIDKFTRYGDKRQELKVCPRLFTSCDVLPDGQMTHWCHTLLGGEHKITEMPIPQQWNSSGYNEVRKRMLTQGKGYWEHCCNCEMIHQTAHPEDILDGHEAEILARMASANNI